MISKIICVSLLLASIFSFLSDAKVHAASAATFYKEGKPSSVQQAVEQLHDCDVIVFGEYHDDKAIHQMEAEFLKNIYQTEPNLALSLEMIERDVQLQVDAYLQDKITETEFVTQIRPWKNYLEDYRPMVNFAKTNKLDVIASNIPRFIAAQYAKDGTLDRIADDKKQYLPQVHQVLKNQYYVDFKQYMKSGQAAMMMDDTKLERFYRAQCLKDDTMAESIAHYIKQNPAKKVLHVQGAFHSHNRLGVVEKLQVLEPTLKIGVITPVHNDIDVQQEKADLFLVVKK
jgi:uncharacterized iron-regulated protein